MKLEKLPYTLTVAKAKKISDFNIHSEFFFLGKTDEEISIVSKTEDTPKTVLEREDGWRAFRIASVLDFSLVGILSAITAILAENGIGIFAVSTFNTDYILVKDDNFEKAAKALEEAGYEII